VDDYGFSKNSRLLTAADFKAVFSNAQFRISCRHFLVLAICSDRLNPKVGLVIAKKHVSLAVQRNRIKRLIRDSFRLHRELLSNLELVVLARKDADKLDNEQITKTLSGLWQELTTKQKRKELSTSSVNR